ncbi:MAG TPA: hypothetical protein VGF48_12885 [Thermoanaerobaculia bacterium]
MTARLSEAELERWLPVPFQEITDPFAAAEPSKGALLQLDSGHYFVVYWGRDSEQLTVRIARAVEPSFFLDAFLREVPLPRERVSWVREGARLPREDAYAAEPQVR